MKCESCGYNIPEGYEICPNCHTPIKKEETPKDFGSLDNTSFNDDKLDIEQYIRNPENKKKLPIIFGSIIMASLVLIIVFGLAFINKKDDKNYFEVAVDSFFEGLDTYFISAENNSGHYKLLLELPENDYKFEGDYEYDIKNKLANISVKMDDSNKKDQTIILESDDFVGNLYLENNKLYINSSNLSNVPVLVNINDLGSLTNKYNEKTIISSIQSAIDSSIKMNDITRKKEVLEFHGDKLNIKSQSFIITKVGYQKMIEGFFEELDEDSALMNELKRMTKLERDDISKFFANLKNEYKYSNISDEDIEGIVYYKKGKIYRIELSINNKTIRLDKVDDNYYFSITEGDKELFKADLNIIKGENDKGDTFTYELSIEYNSKKYDISLSLSDIKNKKVDKQKIDNAVVYSDMDDTQFGSFKSNVSKYFNNTFDSLLSIERINQGCLNNPTCECSEENCSCTLGDKTFKCPIKTINKEG